MSRHSKCWSRWERVLHLTGCYSSNVSHISIDKAVNNLQCYWVENWLALWASWKCQKFLCQKFRMLNHKQFSVKFSSNPLMVVVLNLVNEDERFQANQLLSRPESANRNVKYSNCLTYRLYNPYHVIAARRSTPLSVNCVQQVWVEVYRQVQLFDCKLIGMIKSVILSAWSEW